DVPAVGVEPADAGRMTLDRFTLQRLEGRNVHHLEAANDERHDYAHSKMGRVLDRSPQRQQPPFRARCLSLTVVSLPLLLACGRPAAGVDAGMAAHDAGIPIRHIVVIVKENHTFDNYFGTFPGAEGTTTYLLSDGGTGGCGRAPGVTPRDLAHDHEDGL